MSILTIWWLACSRTSDPREQDGSSDGCHNLVSEVTHHCVHHLLLVTQASSESVWEGTTQGCEQQKPRSIWSHLGGWLHFTSIIHMISFNFHNKDLRLISILLRKKLKLREDKGLPEASRRSGLIPGPDSFSPLCFLWTQYLVWLDSAALKGWRSSGRRKLQAA